MTATKSTDSHCVIYANVKRCQRYEGLVTTTAVKPGNGSFTGDLILNHSPTTAMAIIDSALDPMEASDQLIAIDDFLTSRLDANAVVRSLDEPCPPSFVAAGIPKVGYGADRIITAHLQIDFTTIDQRDKPCENRRNTFEWQTLVAFKVPILGASLAVFVAGELLGAGVFSKLEKIYQGSATSDAALRLRQ